ncbi:nitroreductase family deazaflavin-dependent oxidoreductase [soil metagenome]
MTTEMDDWNTKAIAEFRGSDGRTEMWGDRLVIIHSIGAKSGEERLNPVLGIPRDGSWLVIASRGGAPQPPSWYWNLRAHPDVILEANVGGSIAEVPVSATEITDDAEYALAWALFTQASPAFEKYTEKTEGRRMQILELTPREGAQP